jgi:hypothetical protein
MPTLPTHHQLIPPAESPYGIGNDIARIAALLQHFDADIVKAGANALLKLSVSEQGEMH